jgi:excisionase family DNA binding protein
MAWRKTVSVLPAKASATPVVNPEPILTIEDIADRLKFDSTRTVYELTRTRNKRPMPAMRAGKFLRFYWSDVEKWLRAEEVA